MTRQSRADGAESPFDRADCPSGAAAATDWAAFAEQLRADGIHQLRVSWADLHGSFRSKTLLCGAADDGSGADLQRALADTLGDGIGMVSTLLLKDSSDRSALPVFGPTARLADGTAPEWRSASNMVLQPDRASYRRLPWAAGTGWLRASPRWADGCAVEADPRRVLQRAVAELQVLGLSLQCGLEVEFHVHRIVDSGAAAADSTWPAPPPQVALLHPGYQLLSEAHGDAADDVLQIVRSTALGLGLPLRSLEIEFGPSQFEAVFAPTDAVTAADHMLLFRNGVRQALRRAGYHASFACMPPFPNVIASGWHLHQSLVDAEGHNQMAIRSAAGAGSEPVDPHDAHRLLSDTGAQWLAGLLAHAAGMAALCVPTIAGYQRFQGSVMAPCAPVWGFDNRGAMLRVLGPAGSAATRIENRLPEPMANPYLALAAQIAAGIDGLQRRLQPGPQAVDPYAAMAAASGGGSSPSATRLPASLADALAALADDEVLQRMLGPSMAAVHDAVRRQELARHAAAPDGRAWEAAEYFARF